MGAKALREGIFDGELLSIYFFNRRLLSGDDLQREQRSTREHERRLGQAVGDGIAYGFEVSRKPADSAPNVLVSPGIAVNRRGRVLSLSQSVELAIVPTSDTTVEGAGTFSDCTGGTPGVYLGSLAGLYLLVVAPATGTEGGLASTSGLGNEIVTCNSKYQSEGVQFRLIPLNDGFTNSELADVAHLRNLAAYRCYEGTGVNANPFQNTPGTYGLLDTLRPSTLTACDVPLAILHFPTLNQLAFIDAWSVRRRIATSLLLPAQLATDDPVPKDARWLPYNGERRISEADARFQQFQDQLNSIQLEGSSVVQNLRATDRFRFLPPSGYLPVTATGVQYERFLGNLIRQPARKANKGLLRYLIHRAWTMDPIDLSLTLPTPVDVWRASDSDAFVIFTRSVMGRVLVTYPSGVTALPKLTLNATDSTWTSETTASTSFGLSADVPAGPYQATVDATGYTPLTNLSVTSIPGETVLLTANLVPLPKGRMVVTVTSKGRNVGDLIEGVILTRAGATGLITAVRVGRTFVADQLASGVYTVTVDPGTQFQPGSQGGIVIAAGSDVAVEIQIEPRVVNLGEPPRRFKVDRIEKPPLEKVELVLVVERAERDGKFLFPSAQESKSARTSGQKTLYRKSVKVNFDSVPLANYDSYSADLKYEIGPAATRLDPIALSGPMKQWLRQWRDYLTQVTGVDEAGNAAPAVYVDNAIAVAQSGATVANWQAIAEFGPITIPMLIILDSQSTKGSVYLGTKYIEGVGQQKIDVLSYHGILRVDELAVAPELFLINTLGDPPPEFVQSIVVDAGQAVVNINKDFGYLDGVDEDIAEKLHGSGINDLVALANADPIALGASIGRAGLAVRLISQAQDLLPANTWSLDALPLTGFQKENLERSGIRTLGDFQRKTASKEDRTALAENILPDTPVRKRDQMLNELVRSAISEQAFSSVQQLGRTSLVELSNMDGARASKLKSAGIDSLEALAGADKKMVAAAAEVSESVASVLIDEAKERSLSAKSLSLLAPLSAEANQKLTKAKVKTLGSIIESANEETVSKSIGDAGVAAAIADGVRRALKP